jgi:trehalose 6-phosphate phosphatase
VSRPLCDHLQEVAERVNGANHLLVGLDYDGTLTPIVPDPADAHLAPAARELIKAVAALPNTSVAIISGRSLQDVRARVGVDGLFYAGNHGLEIVGPGLRFLEPTSAQLETTFHDLAIALRDALATVPGVIVENKSLSVSVHFRKVVPSQKSEVAHQVHALVPDTLLVKRGNEVFEVVPAVDWHKGAALALIVEHLGKPATLFIGDDRTDEDAFRTLTGAITIRVGDPAETAARYHVADPAAVHDFLAWLARLCGERIG